MLLGLNGDHPVDSLFVLCITESTRYTFIENISFLGWIVSNWWNRHGYEIFSKNCNCEFRIGGIPSDEKEGSNFKFVQILTIVYQNY